MFLEVPVAGAAAPKCFPHRGGFLFGGEQGIELEDRGTVRILRRFDRAGIGHDAHDLFPHFLFIAENVDRVSVALAHLLAVEAGNRFRLGLDARLRQLEYFAERLIHLHGKIARDLDVLLLIFADRHDVAVIDQNVSRHQDRIREKPRGSAQAARDLVFVRMGALEQSHRRDGGQNPGQLSDLRHIGLAKERRSFRIEPAGEKIDGHAPAIFPQRRRILQAGEGMIIGDKIKRVAFGLERDRRPHHAEIISDVENAAGLNAGKDAHWISLPVILSEVDAVTQPTKSARPGFPSRFVTRDFTDTLLALRQQTSCVSKMEPRSSRAAHSPRLNTAR